MIFLLIPKNLTLMRTNLGIFFIQVSVLVFKTDFDQFLYKTYDIVNSS